jgi:hypothetical protein
MLLFYYIIYPYLRLYHFIAFVLAAEVNYMRQFYIIDVVLLRVHLLMQS